MSDYKPPTEEEKNAILKNDYDVAFQLWKEVTGSHRGFVPSWRKFHGMSRAGLTEQNSVKSYSIAEVTPGYWVVHTFRIKGNSSDGFVCEKIESSEKEPRHFAVNRLRSMLLADVVNDVSGANLDE